MLMGIHVKNMMLILNGVAYSIPKIFIQRLSAVSAKMPLKSITTEIVKMTYQQKIHLVMTAVVMMNTQTGVACTIQIILIH